MGDGFLAYFTSTRRALDCAIDIQRRCASPDGPRVRIGLHCGEVIHEDDDIFGAAVSAVARIMAQTTGGEIVVSDLVRQLAGAAGVRFSARRPVQLTGLDGTWLLHDVAWRAGGGDEPSGPAPGPDGSIDRLPISRREAEVLAALQFGVLGSLEVRRGNDLVDIGSSNERRILAALLVDANAVVSTSRLIAAVWGDDPPASDRNALQTYVARLRRRLRTIETPDPIVTRPPGYAIELGPHELDSLHFCELMDQARASLPLDPARALEMLDNALEMWRGPAFAEFADDDIVRAEAARLDGLRQVCGRGPRRRASPRGSHR